MFGFVGAIIKSAYDTIPARGTANRAILNSMPFLLFSRATERGRVEATFVALSLSGRLELINDPFIQWMCSSEEVKETAELAKTNLEAVLIRSQNYDLICKVIVSVAFYMTSNISFLTALTKILSHSKKVSEVAQPILDKIAASPAARVLQASRVIMFAPVIAKLIHMALIYMDPKGENQTLETLKTGANKTSQALEFLWNLRFSLLCLGISTTFYSSVVSTIYSLAVQRLISDKRPAKQVLSTVGSFFGGDVLPSWGFSMGLDNMITSLSVTSAPYDIATLEQLYKQATSELALESKPEEKIKKLNSDISAAEKAGKISNFHATELRSLAFETISSQYPENLNEDRFLDVESEKTLLAIYGKNGLIHTFATDHVMSDEAFLLSTRLSHERFELNLSWYLQKQPLDDQKQKTCELLLLKQALEAGLDFDRIAKTIDFEEHQKDVSQIAIPEIYVKRSKKYDFARSVCVIPDDFKFSTFSLPYQIFDLRKKANATINTWTKPAHFPSPWSESWTASSIPMESKEPMQKETQELINLLKSSYGLKEDQNIFSFFVPSQAIRDAAITQ